MKTIVQALARGLIVLMPLWLSACIDVTAVRQPANGQINVPFEVEVDVATTSACGAGATCVPYLAVNLPAGWIVESCAYGGGVSGTCSSSTDPLPVLPSTPLNAWRQLKGAAITPAVDLPVGSIATVTLRIRPTSLGAHTMGYLLGASNNDSTQWSNTGSTDHPITIQAAAATPTAVPTLGIYGYGLLALGLAAGALRQRRKSKGG